MHLTTDPLFLDPDDGRAPPGVRDANSQPDTLETKSNTSRNMSKKDDAAKQQDIRDHEDEIFYSPRYSDDDYEQIARWLPQPRRILKEDEWRGLGIKQSLGWEHYMLHDPEPHILIFRRAKDTPASKAATAQVKKAGGLVG